MSKEELISELHELKNAYKKLSFQQSDEDVDESNFIRMIHQHNAIMLLIEPISGNIIDANNSACDFYGYTIDELRKISINDINILSPSQIQDEKSKAANKEQNVFTFHHKTSKGEIRIVEVHSSPIELNNKKILFSIISDITERKILDDALKTSEKHLKRAEIIGKFGSWQMDLKTNIFTISVGAKNIYGANSNEMSLKEVQSRTITEDRTLLDKSFSDLIQYGKPYNVKFKIRRFSDEKIVDIHSIAEFDKEENLLFGTIQDITDSNRLNELLRESNAKFQVLFDTFPLGITISDNDGKIIESNKKAETLLGLSNEEQLKRSITGEEWKIINNKGDDFPQLEYPSIIALKEKKLVENVEMGIVNGDNVTWLNVTAAPIPADNAGVVITYNDITEKKKAEEELNSYFTNALDLFCIADTDGRFIKLNKEWENCLGYKIEELEGQNLLDFIHQDDLDSTINAMKMLINQKTVFNFTNRYKTKDGSYKVIEWKSTPKGNKIFAAARDITKRIKIEEALRESESNLEHAQRIAKIGSWTWDMIENKVSWSKGMYLVYDIDPDNYDGKPETLINIVHPDDKEKFIDNMNTNLEDGSVPKLEYRIIHIDGSIHYIFGEGRIFFNDEGKPFKAVGTAQDITDRIITEESLYESELRFRNIFNNAPIGIYRTNRKGDILLANPKLIEMLGYSSFDELKNRDIESEGYEDKNERANFIAKIEKNGFVDNYNVVWKTKDKVNIIVNEHSRCVYDNDGNILYYEGTVEDITARKNAEEALRESEEKFRLIIENTSEAILFTEPNGEINFANQEACELLGYTNQEICKLGRTGLVDLNDERLEKAVEIRKKTGKFKGELNLIKKDGSIIPVELTSNIFYDQNGIERTTMIINDITERKKSELAIRESEEKYRNLSLQFEAILDHIPGLIFYKDKENNFIRVNKFTANAFNKKKEELEGTNLRNLYSIEDAEKKYQDDLSVIESGNAKLNIEENWNTADGIRWVNTSKIPFKNNKGEIIGIIGISMDITERKYAEELLIAQENFLRTLTDNLPGMVGYWSKDLICKFANNKYLEWFGKTKEEMLGISLIDLFGEELFYKNKPHVDAALNGNNIKFERTLNKPNNTYGYVWAHYIPDIQNEEVLGFYVLVSDITEVKQTQFKLEEMNNNLNELNATKDKFFSIIAHDLRNPLGNFKQITEMLYDEFNDFDESELLEFLKLLKNSANNIFSLLDNLLEWSRSQRGTIQFNPVDTNLYLLIENLIQLVKPMADNKNIELVNRVRKTIFVFVDVNLLNTVFRNLISNAIKFTPNGGNIEIGIVTNSTNNVEYTDNYLNIYVKDSGVGMPQASINKLFKIEESNSTLGTNKEKGTGLGLILCKEFVEMHKGKIKVESEVGVGSTFWISLPFMDN